MTSGKQSKRQRCTAGAVERQHEKGDYRIDELLEAVGDHLGFDAEFDGEEVVDGDLYVYWRGRRARVTAEVSPGAVEGSLLHREEYP